MQSIKVNERVFIKKYLFRRRRRRENDNKLRLVTRSFEKSEIYVHIAMQTNVILG